MASQSQARSRIWLTSSDKRDGLRPSPEGPCGRRGDAGCDSGESGVAAAASAASPIRSDRRCRCQRAQSLERELVQQLGRDQVELEDRLAQVAIVLLAVDLRGPNLLGRQQPFLEQDRDQGLLARREAGKHGLAGRGSADPASTASRSPAGGCDEEAKNPRRRPPRRAVRPLRSRAGEPCQ